MTCLSTHATEKSIGTVHLHSVLHVETVRYCFPLSDRPTSPTGPPLLIFLGGGWRSNRVSVKAAVCLRSPFHTLLHTEPVVLFTWPAAPILPS